MKYRNKEYKEFSVIFKDNKPETVILYKGSPYGSHKDEVTTYWDNEKLTDKPSINN